MTTAVHPGVYMERRKAILCLCFDGAMLKVRRMLLEHFGYTVLPTNSIEDAKNLAQSKCPDMLLMDNSYPGVDFEQLASQVKNICPATIAVVLSPFFAVQQSSGAIDRFVPKDEGPDVLLAHIGELFEEKSTRASDSATV